MIDIDEELKYIENQKNMRKQSILSKQDTYTDTLENSSYATGNAPRVRKYSKSMDGKQDIFDSHVDLSKGKSRSNQEEQ